MPLTVTHAFVSAKSDSPDATLVRPSNWNANHTITPYTEATWLPVITATTSGDLSVGYAQEIGSYTRVGRTVTVSFLIATNSFTYTTASGEIRISGLPIASHATAVGAGALNMGGWTSSSYTSLSIIPVSGTTQLKVGLAGSGVAATTMAITSCPSAGTVTMQGTLTYETT